MSKLTVLGKLRRPKPRTRRKNASIKLQDAIKEKRVEKKYPGVLQEYEKPSLLTAAVQQELLETGAVMVKSVFPTLDQKDTLLSKLLSHAQHVLQYDATTGKMSSPARASSVAVVERDSGRYDCLFLPRGLDKEHATIGKELKTDCLKLLDAAIAEPLKRLVMQQNQREDHKWHSTLNIMLTTPGAVDQGWHVDMPPFERRRKGGLRDWYFTVMVPLTDTLGAGSARTEFIDRQTHQRRYWEWPESDRFAARVDKLASKAGIVSPKVPVGDVLVFDGFKVHRGSKASKDAAPRWILYYAFGTVVDQNAKLQMS